MEESRRMLRQAADEGIREMILTPHQKPDRHCVSRAGLLSRMAALQSLAEEDGLDITLYPGGELFFRQGLADELLKHSLCTLADSRYVLVEFFPLEHYDYIRNGLYGLLAAGYWPVLAHVERYAQINESGKRQRELLDMGCFYQVNAASLTGAGGFGVFRTAWRLVKEKMVHFIATDAHREDGNRAPQLTRCARLLEKKCGSEYAAQLLCRNAAMILKDEALND